MRCNIAEARNLAISNIFLYPLKYFFAHTKPFRAGAADSRTIFFGHIYFTGITAYLEFVAYLLDISTERTYLSYCFQNLPEQNKSWPLGNACINWKKHLTISWSSRASLIELLKKISFDNFSPNQNLVCLWTEWGFLNMCNTMRYQLRFLNIINIDPVRVR